MKGTGKAPLVAAVAFAVLYLAAGLVVDTPPDLDADGAAIAGYFADNADELQGGAYTIVLSGVALLVFVAMLRRRLDEARTWIADAVYGAALVVLTLGTATGLVQLALAWTAEELDPATAKALYAIVAYFPPLVTGAIFVMAAGVAIGSLRHGILPRWIGRYSAAFAAYEIVESLTIYGDDGAFLPGEAINMIGVIAFLVWVLLVGAGISRPAVTPAPVEPA